MHCFIGSEIDLFFQYVDQLEILWAFGYFGYWLVTADMSCLPKNII